MKCQDCDGTGKIILFSSIKNCDSCGGTGIRKGKPSSVSEWYPVLQMMSVSELREVARSNDIATSAKVAAMTLLMACGVRYEDGENAK